MPNSDFEDIDVKQYRQNTVWFKFTTVSPANNHLSGPGTAGPGVCVCVQATTLKLNNFWPRHLAFDCRCLFQVRRLIFKVTRGRWDDDKADMIWTF